MKTIKVTAPGKLMLSGEWAVLELGVPCVVMAIDKKVTVELKPNEVIAIKAPDLKLEEKQAEFDGKKLNWKQELSAEEKEKLLIAEHAIETTLKYLQEKNKKINNFYITTGSSDAVVQLPTGEVKKIGFGSSAAICVAIVEAILKFHCVETESDKAKEIVFKLSALAHFEAQGKVGSCFDIAASTFSGLLAYKKFDGNWLAEQAKAGKKLSEIVESKWPVLFFESLKIPKNFELIIGYTGPDTSTKEMILKMNSFKETKKEEYAEIIENIKRIVEELIPAIKKQDEKRIIDLLQENRKWLKQLSEKSGNNLETEKLAQLAEIAEQNNAAGKFSGSGGGGLGIIICFDKKTRNKIENELKQAGIEPVKANITKK